MTPRYWTMLLFDMSEDEIVNIMEGKVTNYEKEAAREELLPEGESKV